MSEITKEELARDFRLAMTYLKIENEEYKKAEEEKQKGVKNNVREVDTEKRKRNGKEPKITEKQLYGNCL